MVTCIDMVVVHCMGATCENKEIKMYKRCQLSKIYSYGSVGVGFAHPVFDRTEH